MGLIILGIDQNKQRILAAGICVAAIVAFFYFRIGGDTADPAKAKTSGKGIASQNESPTLHKNDDGDVIGAEFYGAEVSPEQISALQEHAGLQELTFYECQGFDELVDAELVKSDRVKSLHIVRSVFDDSNLARMSSMSAVEHLTLSNVSVTATGLASLKDWSNLKRLSLEGNIELTALQGLSDVDQLQQLDVAIGEGEAEYLTKNSFPDLRRLSISDNTFGDEDLTLLPEWKTLEFFEFGAENITDAGVAQLSKFPSLKELVLMDSQVSDDGLSVLKDLKNLEFVSLMNCSKVTNESMSILAAMPALQRLMLIDSGVTGAGLMKLAPSKSLRYIGIADTQASVEEVAKLSAALPECNVDRIQNRPPE